MNRERASSPPPEVKQSDIEKSLGIEGGSFIKRSERSGGKIDKGWRAGLETKTREEKPGVQLTKKIGGEYQMRNVSAEEFVRLNTGRNRGALEYLQKLPDRHAKELSDAVDRADESAEAREQLKVFFGQEVFRKAQALFEGSSLTLKAKNLEDLTDELTEKLGQLEDLRIGKINKTLAGARAQEQAERARRARDISPERIEAIEADIRGLQDAKKAWKSEVDTLLRLIDLAGQFEK